MVCDFNVVSTAAPQLIIFIYFARLIVEGELHDAPERAHGR